MKSFVVGEESSPCRLESWCGVTLTHSWPDGYYFLWVDGYLFSPEWEKEDKNIQRGMWVCWTLVKSWWPERDWNMFLQGYPGSFQLPDDPFYEGFWSIMGCSRVHALPQTPGWFTIRICLFTSFPRSSYLLFGHWHMQHYQINLEDSKDSVLRICT